MESDMECEYCKGEAYFWICCGGCGGAESQQILVCHQRECIDKSRIAMIDIGDCVGEDVEEMRRENA